LLPYQALAVAILLVPVVLCLRQKSIHLRQGADGERRASASKGPVDRQQRDRSRRNASAQRSSWQRANHLGQDERGEQHVRP
jgi:hypothetical protein